MRHFILLSWLLVSFLIMRNEALAGPGLCRVTTLAPSLPANKDVPCSIDPLGNIRFTKGTTDAGEDTLADVQKVEERFSYVNITLAAPTTTTVKSSAGLLHKITVNKAAANGVITCYDNTVASGNVIATITMPATLLASQIVLDYDVVFNLGLVCITSGAAQDLTISYRLLP